MGLYGTLLASVVLTTHRSEPVGPLGQIIIVIVCLVIGGAVALVGFGYLQTYNRARKTDPTPLRRVTDTGSEVELSGTAEVHETTSAPPFTNTGCLAHEWQVKRHDAGSDSGWTRLDSGNERNPFQLDDGTGTALVDPDGATLELTDTKTIEIDADETPPPGIDEYLERTEQVNGDIARKHRYIERRLEPGDDVHVFGPVQRTGHSADMPGGVDAIIGVTDADRGFTVGEDGLTELVDQIKTDTMRYVITPGEEKEAERHLLKQGLLFAGFGIVFALIPLGFVLFL